MLCELLSLDLSRSSSSATLQSAYEALPLRRVPVESPLGGQLDSTYDGFLQEIRNTRIGNGVPVGSEPVEPKSYIADSR